MQYSAYKNLVNCDLHVLYEHVDNLTGEFNTLKTFKTGINYDELNDVNNKYFTWLKIDYIYDIWRRESRVNATGKTKDYISSYIEELIDIEELTNGFEAEHVYNPRRMAIKTRNLNTVIDKYIQNNTNYQFNIEMVKDVHSIIMADLNTHGGEFRILNAKPSGFNMIYLPPSKIQKRLTELLDIISEKIHECNNDKHAVAIAAEFYTEFLHIHPFSNGNGRTARILTNYLLKKFFVLPFKLIVTDANKHMEILNECQKSLHIRPKKIVDDFIKGLLEHYDKLYYLTC